MSSPVIDELLGRVRDLYASVPAAPASATTVGGVRLAGDLGGDAESPTVPSLGQKADLDPVTGLVVESQLPAGSGGGVADDDPRLSDARDTTVARITDASATGRAVLAGSQWHGRDALSVYSKAECRDMFAPIDAGGAAIDDGATGTDTVWSSQKTADELGGKAPKDSPVFTGVVEAPSVKLTTGAGAGKVLTAAADGTASWEEPEAGGGGTPGVSVSGLNWSNTPSYIGPIAAPPAPMGGAVIIGDGASCSSHSAVAIGLNAKSSQGVAIGNMAKAEGTSYPVAIGALATASAPQSTAVGRWASASHADATALGVRAQTTAASQVMLGTASETVVAPNKLQVGPDGALSATLSTRANGSGKTELIVQFATGDPIILATQP